MGGPCLTLTRADLEPLWHDPNLSQQDIVDLLGISRTSLLKLKHLWQLPRRPRSRFKVWNCDACRFRGWCNWAVSVDYRFPCMPEGEWGAGDRWRNGDGSSPED